LGAGLKEDFDMAQYSNINTKLEPVNRTSKEKDGI
jgi:hypothetical protein